MPLALYRRYRPETFSEVIGQEHVTGPLQQALRNDRVHHAYLFSGPRGCGKTTSARILARALNCEQGPTPTPCGKCQSCRDLARGGGGSIDVIEIDAASHGGVDDARDLRERAFFSPAAARYKVYIIDEAHMVTTAGFNALLKVVEEPPEHLKFIFATTEPDKVIGTIRSRTHHYPFRLVPPGVLRDYLASICAEEGVGVDPTVLPLVVRAGAGSVRDALSVLDQLVAGTSPDAGVTYAMAAALLGFTDATLLDDVVDAIAAADGAAVFQVVDHVVEAGHDPRRFVADLLERFRDLVVLDAVPDAATKRLIDGPADQVERMRAQAARFGTADLSRIADILNTGLTEMRGATAPRLQLELICARVLLPGANDSERGAAARLDRLERRFSIGVERGGGSGERVATPQPAGASQRPAGSSDGVPPDDDRVPAPKGSPAPVAAAGAPEPSASPAPAGLDLIGVRRMWPEVLEAVKERRRFTWMMLLDNVQVLGVGSGVLTLAFSTEGSRKAFTSSGSDAMLNQALIDVLGVDWRIETVLDPSGGTSGDGATAARQRESSAPAGAAAPAHGGAGGGSPAPGAAQSGDERAAGADARGDTEGAHADDPAAHDAGLSGVALVQEALGGRRIGEFEQG